MGTRQRLLLAGAALTIAAAAPTVAGATTFCVRQSGSCPATEVDEGASLTQALQAAMATGADTIDLGAGTYMGPFPNPGAEALSIVGAGQGATILTEPATDSTTVLGLGSVAVDVSDLTVVLPHASNVIGIRDGNGLIDHVTITGDPAAATVDIGVEGVGGVQVAHSTLDVPFGLAVESLGTPGVGTVHVSDSTLSGGVGVDADPGPDVSVQRVAVNTTREGIVANGSTVAVDDSTFRAASPTAADFNVSCGSATGATLTADHVTLIGSGVGTAVRSQCNGAGFISSVTLSNSIIRSFAHPLARSALTTGEADLHVSSSDFDPALASDSGGLGAITLGSGDINADPLFVSSSDAHLQSGSPAFDAGDAGAPLFATDLDGSPRLSGAAQDMGAYELQVPPPVVQTPSGGGGGGGSTGSTGAAAAGAAGPAAEAPSTPMTAGPSAPAPSAPGRPTTIAPGVVKQPAALRAADLRSMLRHGRRSASGASYTLAWRAAGRLQVTWHASTSHGAVVATGSASRSSAGRGRLVLHVTKAGRARLEAHPKTRLVATASFTPKRGKAIHASTRLAAR